MTRDQILAALPGLGQDDLKALQTVIGSLLGQHGVAGPARATGPQAWLFEAVRHSLGVNVFTVKGAAQYNKYAPTALTFISDTFKCPVFEKRTAATALMHWLLVLLVEDMKVKRIPIGPTTICEGLGRLPLVFESAYPGYRQAGLSGLLAQKALGLVPAQLEETK